jgi:arabinoxylan arabinofuranohydrolase
MIPHRRHSGLKRMVFISGVLLLYCLRPAECPAQNPIVPPGVYLADPSARVWPDGRLYVYGSRDENPAYYCSWSHDALSTTDLRTWTLHPNIFASRGEGDEVPYSDNPLYAPDVQFRDGTYYMYYTIADVRHVEGVAVSGSPTGPFRDGRNIELHGYSEIDPAVFIDDDGQAYYLWGQFTAKMAKLKPNMLELDSATVRDSVLTEAEHFFHEGGFLTRRKGIYYFIYAHMGRAGRPTCIAYATSDAPFGPYRYGGVIIDNDHSDPAVWNNHGSIAEYRGQWYVFYHRSTHNSVTMRKACVEPIFFNADGSIDEVEMTSQGAGPPLDAFRTIEAERACLLYGNVRIQSTAPGTEELTGLRNDDKAAYKYVDFGAGAGRFSVRVAPGKQGGRIDIALGSSWSYPPIGSLEVPGGGDGNTWVELSCPVKKTAGVHALWLRFYGEGDDLFRVDRFGFGPEEQ